MFYYLQVTGEGSPEQLLESLRRYTNRARLLEETLNHLSNIHQDEEPREDIVKVMHNSVCIYIVYSKWYLWSPCLHVCLKQDWANFVDGVPILRIDEYQSAKCPAKVPAAPLENTYSRAY